VTFRVPIPEDLLAGNDLVAGRYRLETVLGMGGMGYVMSATQVEPGGAGRRVAIKFMLPDALRSASLHSRFVREAEAIGRLRSEHVCRLLDTGRLPGGAPFMVMEHLLGADLERLVSDQGPLPLWEAADYTLQILEAIAEAHSQGIIHRDLKPANVFRAWVGDEVALIKVLDFGVAKAADGLHSTATDSVMGSPAYMAPEQIVSSKRVDERADIYSIGAILYFLLTGKPPFEAEQLPALCLKVLNEDPAPPSLHRPDLPAEVDEIILTCMARDQLNRYPNAAELAFALLPFAPERCTPLAEAAFRAIGHAPGKWQRPPRAVATGVATVSFRGPRGNSEAPRTDPVTGRGRRRSRLAWLTALLALAAVGIGGGAAMLLDREAGPPAPRTAAPQQAAPESAPAESAPAESAPESAPAAAVAAPAAADETEPAASPESSADREKERRPVTRARTRKRRPRAERARPPAATRSREEPAPPAERKPACAPDDPLCAFGTAR